MLYQCKEYTGFFPLPLPPGEGRGEGVPTSGKAPYPVIKPSPRERGNKTIASAQRFFKVTLSPFY
jgi:hypothetical protein